jgi:hypothetical protein
MWRVWCRGSQPHAQGHSGDDEPLLSIDKRRLADGGTVQRVYHELVVLMQLFHRNITICLKVRESHSLIVAVLEFCSDFNYVSGAIHVAADVENFLRNY